MAPPPSDPSIQRQKKGAPIKFLIPLIYAPVLPLVRLTLRHKPVLRDRVFGAVLVGAFAHGFYLVYVRYGSCCLMSFFLMNMFRTDIYDAESK